MERGADHWQAVLIEIGPIEPDRTYTGKKEVHGYVKSGLSNGGFVVHRSPPPAFLTPF